MMMMIIIIITIINIINIIGINIGGSAIDGGAGIGSTTANMMGSMPACCWCR
jgi:hypothetical protein